VARRRKGAKKENKTENKMVKNVHLRD